MGTTRPRQTTSKHMHQAGNPSSPILGRLAERITRNGTIRSLGSKGERNTLQIDVPEILASTTRVGLKASGVNAEDHGQILDYVWAWLNGPSSALLSHSQHLMQLSSQHPLHFLPTPADLV